MSSSARSIKHGTFVIERKFDFDPAFLYRAWTQPDAKARWFNGPHDKWKEQVREMDVRPGGRERLLGRFADGSESRFEALYFDVVPDRRLVFSWAWHSTPERESLVTVQLKPDGAGTLLTFHHEQFVDQTARDNHERGWTELFDKLDRYLA